jgi:hypothetical protein
MLLGPQRSSFRFVKVAIIPVVPNLIFPVVPPASARARIEIELWCNRMGCLQQMLSFGKVLLCPGVMTCEKD